MRRPTRRKKAPETPTKENELKAAKAVPLVDNIKDLTKIDLTSPAWIDAKHKEVVVGGRDPIDPNAAIPVGILCHLQEP